MLSIKGNVDNLDKLEAILNKVKTQNKMQSNINELYAEIKKKCLNTVKSIARQRLYASGTTNEEYYEAYIANIRIGEENEKGFTIISDLTIHKPDTHHSKGYDFSISLAFEYGTGIVGMGSTDAPPEYRYNVNNNYVIIDDYPELGWWIPIEKAGNSHIFATSKSGKAVVTQGYEAVEVFRHSADKINLSLNKWINEFNNRKSDK